jgi:hypothetical protein
LSKGSIGSWKEPSDLCYSGRVMLKIQPARRPRPLDAAVIILVLLVIVLVSFPVSGNKGTPSRLLVQSEGQTFIYPLNSDRMIEVQGPDGITSLEISDGRARFVESPCPDKLCISHGWLARAGSWTACLPNKVFASVEGGEEEPEIDFLAY